MEGQGTFSVVPSFMPSCSLPGPSAVPMLPDIMQAQLRPFKLAQTPLASIAEAVLCSCGFHADAVGHASPCPAPVKHMCQLLSNPTPLPAHLPALCQLPPTPAAAAAALQSLPQHQPGQGKAGRGLCEPGLPCRREARCWRLLCSSSPGKQGRLLRCSWALASATGWRRLQVGPRFMTWPCAGSGMCLSMRAPEHGSQASASRRPKLQSAG